MVFKLGSYIKFVLTATNHHGVHSPFVYQYLTKCLYVKPHGYPKITGHVIISSINYFKVRNAKIAKHFEPILKYTKAEYPSLNLDKKPYDLLCIPEPDLD